MHNANKPDLSELPSAAKLLRSTMIAAATAAVILVAVVLPAEYGVDPTRIGSVLGLTEMGRIKMQLAGEAEAEPVLAATVDAPQATAAAEPDAPEIAPEVAPEVTNAWRDEISFTLAADAAAEFKLIMKEGALAQFEWYTDGAKANYDTHADRPGVDYHNYDKGSLARQEGSLVAAFDGSHGWFWRNRSGAPLTITLKTRGDYSKIKRVL